MRLRRGKDNPLIIFGIYLRTGHRVVAPHVEVKFNP
jgi:hypothetical protein